MIHKDCNSSFSVFPFFLSFLSFSFWYAIWILKTEEEENPVSTKFYIHYPSKRPRNQIYWYCLCLPNEPFEILKWHQYRFLEELTDINSLAKSELQTSEHLSYLESSISFLFFSVGLEIGSADCCAYMRKETEMSPKLITGFTSWASNMTSFAECVIYVKCVRHAKDNITQFTGTWGFNDEQATWSDLAGCTYKLWELKALFKSIDFKRGVLVSVCTLCYVLACTLHWGFR